MYACLPGVHVYVVAVPCMIDALVVLYNYNAVYTRSRAFLFHSRCRAKGPLNERLREEALILAQGTEAAFSDGYLCVYVNSHALCDSVNPSWRYDRVRMCRSRGSLDSRASLSSSIVQVEGCSVKFVSFRAAGLREILTHSYS